MDDGDLFKTADREINERDGRNDGRFPQRVRDRLLLTVEVIKDPVQGDIRLTPLESTLIRTVVFQRLGFLNQLGTTRLVYPGTVHDRFMHSLGVLHVCSKMIEKCNRNADLYGALAESHHPKPLKLDYYSEFLARLVALMHDLAHVPYSHILKREGRIFENDEWENDGTADRLLGDDSEVHCTISNFFEENDIDTLSATTVVEDVRQILTESKRDPNTGKPNRVTIDKLDYPFIHDLVCDTLCADMLDYTTRDAYFSGLKERTGDRLLDYLAILPVAEKATNGKKGLIYDPANQHTERGRTIFKTSGQRSCRVVLLQYRYDRLRIGKSEVEPRVVTKNDIADEAVDLIRLRLTLAQKLYYHRTNIAASAMLIAAVHACNILNPADILELSDGEFMKFLQNAHSAKDILEELAIEDKQATVKERYQRVLGLTDKLRQTISLLDDSSSKRASTIATALLTRRLYKPIFLVNHRYEDDRRGYELIQKLREDYSQPSTRLSLVKKIESYLSLEKENEFGGAMGSACIWCPPGSNVKELDMLSLYEPTDNIMRLEDSRYPPTVRSIRAIKESHAYLWSFVVYVDLSILKEESIEDVTRVLVRAISSEIGGIPNDLDRTKARIEDSFDNLLRTKRVDIALNTMPGKDGIRSMAKTISQDVRRQVLDAVSRGDSWSQSTESFVEELRKLVEEIERNRDSPDDA